MPAAWNCNFHCVQDGTSSWADLGGVNSDDEEHWAPSLEAEAGPVAQAVAEGSAGEQQA